MPYTYGIYVITQIGTDKCCVGQSIKCEARWKERLRLLRRGKHHARYLQNAFDMHGEQAFAFNIAQADTNGDQLTAMEQKCMDLLKPCFNTWQAGPTRRGLPGPWKGKTMTEASRLKMSLAKRGKPSGRLGIKHTEEAITRMSASRRGQPSGFKGKSSLYKGVPRSAEVRAAISAGHKRAYAAGRVPPIMSVSPEERSRRAKLAAAARWSMRTEENSCPA